MTSRMDRNSRAAPRRAPRRSAAGSTLLGVFIGVALGLGLAAAVAFYLMRAGNPYQTTANTRDVSREVSPGRSGKADAGTAKPRFDFYKILPGVEEPKVQTNPADRSADKATVERTLTPEPTTTAKLDAGPAPSPQQAADRFWLQAGSFANQGEAENLKARLALAGLEAAVQQADIPDKGVRYRVRLGPYDNTDELSRMKGELGRRGFDVAVIKY